MNRPSIPPGWRPGLRAGVLSVSAVLVAGTALAVAVNVSDHLARTAIDEAVGSTEAVVRGYVDPMVAKGGFATPASDQRAAIDAQLSRLVASGKILRIKIWAPDGTVAFSDLAALRGRQFPVGAGARRGAPGERRDRFLERNRRGERLRARTRPTLPLDLPADPSTWEQRRRRRI